MIIDFFTQLWKRLFSKKPAEKPTANPAPTKAVLPERKPEPPWRGVRSALKEEGEFLPLWYEEGYCECVIAKVSRHISGCLSWNSPETCACDYQLVPIRREDADLSLFVMVSDAALFRINGLEEVYPTNDADFTRVLPKPEDYGESEGYMLMGYYLLFPAHEPVFISKEYPELPPAILAVSGEDGKYIGEAGLITDCYPRIFYALQPVGEGHELRYKELAFKTSIPYFPNNYMQLSEALTNLLFLLRPFAVNAALTAWMERLLLVQKMLQARANELHILHNAGLYDHQQLWSLMRQAGCSETQLSTIQQRYIHHLYRFAMYAVNIIGWCSFLKDDQNNFLRPGEYTSEGDFLEMIDSKTYYSGSTTRERFEAVCAEITANFDLVQKDIAVELVRQLLHAESPDKVWSHTLVAATDQDSRYCQHTLRQFRKRLNGRFEEMRHQEGVTPDDILYETKPDGQKEYLLETTFDFPEFRQFARDHWDELAEDNGIMVLDTLRDAWYAYVTSKEG